MNYVKPLRMR